MLRTLLCHPHRCHVPRIEPQQWQDINIIREINAMLYIASWCNRTAVTAELVIRLIWPLKVQVS
jgi:hypothetical protein